MAEMTWKIKVHYEVTLQQSRMGTDFEKKTATFAVKRQISLHLHPT